MAVKIMVSAAALKKLKAIKKGVGVVPHAIVDGKKEMVLTKEMVEAYQGLGEEVVAANKALNLDTGDEPEMVGASQVVTLEGTPMALKKYLENGGLANLVKANSQGKALKQDAMARGAAAAAAWQAKKKAEKQGG